MLNQEAIMEIERDRFVTEGVVFPSGAKQIGLVVPVLDDAAIVTLEMAPKRHAWNYPNHIDYATKGITAEWRMDDADGTTITDSVNGLVLTEQGDPTYASSAATPGLGKGVALDGTGDAFDTLVTEVPRGVVPDTGDFSVEVVCNLTSGSGGAGDTIIGCRTGADGVGWQLQLDANEYLDVHIEDSDGQVAQEGATDICTGSIVHILCSFDRDGNLVTYLNGAANATTDISSKEKTILPAVGASNRLSIGGDAARTGGDCLTGTIYFVRLYNRAVGAAEVLDNYRILMNGGYPGWVPVMDAETGEPFVVRAAGVGAGYSDLTVVAQSLVGSVIRARVSVEQTTTPADLKFVWVFA